MFFSRPETTTQRSTSSFLEFKEKNQVATVPRKGTLAKALSEIGRTFQKLHETNEEQRLGVLQSNPEFLQRCL